MTENLRTASLYINNQLLSRGLLSDGEIIDFTNPGGGDGGTAATMGRIMAVVNDLILRRDRDAEHRESLSTTLRTVRAESLRQTNDLQRLQDKHAEATRKLALSEASEASLKTQLKTADATIHKLKDEAARQKTLVAQTRAACANEVRKRERQIEGLKKAVGEAGRARGMGRSNGGLVVVSVAGSLSAANSPASRLGAADDDGNNSSFTTGGPQHAMAAAGTTADGFYDLRSETNAFLAELAKGLSEENETLLALVRSTMGRLKEMSGWERGAEEDGQIMAGAGTGAAAVEMAAEIDAILQHLRTILTNPSFVPIEEVVVREDEIHRLRHGWEKMESRWQEAVHLIDGWKRRMQVSGRPVNMEELKMGLRLSPVRVRNVEETAQGLGGGIGLRLSAVPEDEEDHQNREDGVYDDYERTRNSPSPVGSLRLVPAPGAQHDDYPEDQSDMSSIFEDDFEDDDLDVDQLDVEEPNVEILEQSVMLDSPPLPLPPQLSPLRDNYAAGNRGGTLNYIKRPGDFTTIVEERTVDLRDGAPLPPPHAHIPVSHQSPRKKASQPRLRPVQAEEDSAPPPPSDLATSSSSLDNALLGKPLSDEPNSVPTNKQAQNQAPQPPIPPPKDERRERRKAPLPPAAKQVVPARKPLRPTPAKPASKPQSRREQAQGGKDGSAPAVGISAPSTRTVSASSALSTVDTTTATADTSSTSFTSNNTNFNIQSNLKPTSSSDPSMVMPPPPLPSPSKPSDFSSSSELNKSPRRAGGISSRLPLPRPGSNANLRGEAITQQLNNLNILPPPQQSPLNMASIAAKLAASEREADAARVRAKLKAARMGGSNKRVGLAPAAPSSSSTAGVPDGASLSSRNNSRPASAVGGDGGGGNDDDDVDELAGEETGKSAAPRSPQKRYERTRAREQLQVVKKTAGRGEDAQEEQEEQQQPPVVVQRKVKRDKATTTIGGSKTSSSRRASRRRSTLNPWELETLIQAGVAATTAGGGAGGSDSGQ